MVPGRSCGRPYAITGCLEGLGVGFRRRSRGPTIRLEVHPWTHSWSGRSTISGGSSFRLRHAACSTSMRGMRWQSAWRMVGSFFANSRLRASSAIGRMASRTSWVAASASHAALHWHRSRGQRRSHARTARGDSRRSSRRPRGQRPRSMRRARRESERPEGPLRWCSHEGWHRRRRS